MEAAEQYGIKRIPNSYLNISLTNRQRTVRNAIIKSTGVRRKMCSGFLCLTVPWQNSIIVTIDRF